MDVSVIKLSKDGFGFVDMENLCNENEIRCCDVECGLSDGLDINKFEIKTLNFR